MSSRLLLVTFFMISVSGEDAYDKCREITFVHQIVGKSLKRHLIRSFKTSSCELCQIECYLEDKCVSYNCGNNTCDLNSSDHILNPEDLVNDKGKIYHATENSCKDHQCPPNATCLNGFTDKGYKCKCRFGFTGDNCEKGSLATSCSDLKRKDSSSANGNYVIDPDGAGGLAPFSVYCDMSDKVGVGVTVISHDSEDRTLVDGCDAPGCYSRNVTYTGVSLAQLANLTRVSSHCEQFIKYECYHARLLGFLKYNYSWLVSRDGVTMRYWGGASPGSNKCACGMNNSCAVSYHYCNCGKNDNVWREDSGLLTHKSDLPVSQLRFGDVAMFNNYDEKGYHTLGKLKCYGNI